MCQLMSAFPKHSKSNGGQRKSLVMSLKPCQDENTWYRVRLLAFKPSASSGSDRDDPWIERYVHQHWEPVPGKNYSALKDEITCPVTPHVHVEGDRYDACKVCGIANKYFFTFKESGWKDKDACRKNKEFQRRYQAIIPVYVVNNPNWEGDNGKFRVIIFNDRKFYQEFRKKVERQLTNAPVFNGKGAVDCALHVTEKEEIVNQGQPNERRWKSRVIDKIAFSKTPKDIDAITREALDSMGFDDEYYTTSTPEEINAFYQKYCTISNDDLATDDVAMSDIIPTGNDVKPAARPVDTGNAAAPEQKPVAVDDLLDDPENLPADDLKVESESGSGGEGVIDAAKLLDGFDL